MMECKMLWRKWFKLSTMFLVVLWVTKVAVAGDSSKVANPGLATLQPSHLADTAIDTTQVFVIEIRHRVFKNFYEVDTVCLNQKLPIGEGDYVVQAFLFNPDLAITDKGEYWQGSDTLYNPAVRVRVFEKDSLVQQSWAFHFVDAPHYRRNDLLGFRLMSFKVADRYIKAEGPRPPSPAPADTTRKDK